MAIHIQPRYYRWFVDPGVEWTEKNTRHAVVDWNIPITQCAIVVVDVWNGHYLKDCDTRMTAIIQHNIVPLLAVCRQAGIQIIFAPAAPIAQRHPAWVNLVKEEKKVEQLGGDSWPPLEFRQKSGNYQAYAKPKEARAKEIDDLVKARALHPDVLPTGNDVVVASGEELHRFCKQKEILFLFYVGFNANACILLRDYGTLDMRKRGYEIIVLRDCTTGMESYETQAGLEQTRNAILFLEMFGHYSLTSDAITAALSTIKKQP